MLSFVKKVVDFVFIKKNTTPTYVCANCADQELIDAIYMDDCMFGNNDNYQEVNTCDKPACFADHDNFVKVPSFRSPRSYPIVPDNGGVKKDSVAKKDSGSYFRGNFIRYVSNYAFHALKKSYNLLPIMAKVLNTAYLKEEIDEEPVLDDAIDNEIDYDFFNKTTDLVGDLQVVPKQQEGQDEEFDYVGSSKEVAHQQENDELDALVKEHSLRFPSEAAMVANLKYYPELLRSFVRM